MAVTNTGIVLRTITGVHDANFVHPIGDEEVLNGGFDTDTDWLKGTGWSISGGSANYNTSSNNNLSQAGDFVDGKTYKVTLEVKSYVRGTPIVLINSGASVQVPTAVGIHTMYLVAGTSTTKVFRYYGGGFSSGGEGSIDNISVKEMLVNRESTATNTGIVERSLTGVNESDLWLDSESTSVVNNTGIVERPITGVNESDPMFPDNTISNIVNIAGLISSLLADLEARATTFENREATQNILINLQKC